MYIDTRELSELMKGRQYNKHEHIVFKIVFIALYIIIYTTIYRIAKWL